MKKPLTGTLVLCLLSATALSASSSAPMPQRAQQDPRAEATRSYNDGLRYRDRAWKAEKELTTAQDAGRIATLKEIVRKSYEADARSQRTAISNDPNLFQAHAELGYALRKTGDYANALTSYDKALSMMPNYAEALEYRAEAWLGLNRVAEARETYLQLYNGGDHERAQLLADAMQKWVASRKTDPSGAAPDAVDEMAKWLAQRSEIARQTGASTSGGSWR